MTTEIVVLPTPAAVAEALAERTAEALRQSAGPHVSLCVTGGSTPAPAYERLARAEGIDWDRIHVFWTDERAVPPDHPASNYGMVCRTLLEPAGLPEAHVHRIEGEHGATEAARRYERTLERFFGEGPVRFDVLHLGMGDDGHTASLFPGTAALSETACRCIATTAPPSMPVAERVSLTLPVLGGARRTLIAAHGAAKREAFAAAVAAGPGSGPPVARVAPAGGSPTWLVDRALAAGIAES